MCLNARHITTIFISSEKTRTTAQRTSTILTHHVERTKQKHFCFVLLDQPKSQLLFFLPAINNSDLVQCARIVPRYVIVDAASDCIPPAWEHGCQIKTVLSHTSQDLFKFPELTIRITKASSKPQNPKRRPIIQKNGMITSRTRMNQAEFSFSCWAHTQV